MNLDCKIKVPKNVLAREVGDETVILDLDSGHYYGLDKAGVRMWQLLRSGSTLRHVCDVVALEYAVSRQDLERDVASLVQSLVDAKLVEVSP
jgi:hypothetical protein